MPRAGEVTILLEKRCPGGRPPFFSYQPCFSRWMEILFFRETCGLPFPTGYGFKVVDSGFFLEGRV